ncbi:AI-2E family transporter [Novosphingobium sp. M1R2S20]|uniref:AI-2E family transporter n=1 Tax=Novosphingobium rhizovicinum TaxID=3228928 RepID=A0ABV3RDN8_9SPHN
MSRDADPANASTGSAKMHGQAGPTDITDPRIRHEARRAFAWLAVASIFGLAVLLSASLLVIFGGIVFAALIDGGARLLGKILPLRRGIRITIVLLAALGFVVWVVQFAGSTIATDAAQLPATVQAEFYNALGWLQRHGIEVDVADVQRIAQKATGGISQMTRALTGIIGGLTTIFLIIVLGIYFSLEPNLYRRGVAWMLPADKRDRFQHTVHRMGSALRKLMFGRLIGMIVEGVATWLMLAIYGVPMAFLLGLITGLLAALPNIGAPVSGAIMILVGFSGGLNMGIYTIIVYTLVQTLDGYVIVPFIARQTVDLPPALVLAAQLIMGVLFGILGLALADPLMAMIKVWLESEADYNQRHQDDADGEPPATPIAV